MRDVVRHRVTVRSDAEREALLREASVYAPGEGELVADADGFSVADADDRTTILLATPVLRLRFAGVWPMQGDG